jgi:hypothetical protein
MGCTSEKVRRLSATVWKSVGMSARESPPSLRRQDSRPERFAPVRRLSVKADSICSRSVAPLATSSSRVCEVLSSLRWPRNTEPEML